MDSTPVFDIRGLEVALGGHTVLGPLDLRVSRGSFIGILGPNGSGKTTLLRALTGGVRPSSGDVLLEGRSIQRYRATDLARILGVVPQQFNLDFNFTVSEMVAMGRYSHRGKRSIAPSTQTAESEPSDDTAAVAEAMEATGVTSLAGRLVTELSGGERQRALIAQTLAQKTPILLFDEPLNNLDLNHQLEIMQLLNRLHEGGKTIAVVLHDLNIAAQYCQEMILLDEGQVAARGNTTDILDPRVILEVFKVRVAVHKQGRRPYITPLWSGTSDTRRTDDQTRVHVIAGGGAATELVDELVLCGLTPTVGIVSVFDTDYTTAQRYELEVVSAPPFQPFPPEAIAQLEVLVAQTDTVVIAPVFFGPGNMESLRVTLRAAQAGKKVIVMTEPPIEERDLSGGEATALTQELLAAGAIKATSPRETMKII